MTNFKYTPQDLWDFWYKYKRRPPIKERGLYQYMIRNKESDPEVKRFWEETEIKEKDIKEKLKDFKSLHGRVPYYSRKNEEECRLRAKINYCIEKGDIELEELLEKLKKDIKEELKEFKSLHGRVPILSNKNREEYRLRARINDHIRKGDKELEKLLEKLKKETEIKKKDIKEELKDFKSLHGRVPSYSEKNREEYRLRLRINNHIRRGDIELKKLFNKLKKETEKDIKEELINFVTLYGRVPIRTRKNKEEYNLRQRIKGHIKRGNTELEKLLNDLENLTNKK